MAEALAALGIGLSDSDNRVEPGSAKRRWIRGVVVAVALLTGGAWLALRETALDPRRIVVADLANDTGDSSLAGNGVLAGDIISSRLTEYGRLNVINATIALPSHLQVNLPSADSTVSRVSQALVSSTHAGLAVTGAFFRTGGSLEVVAEVTDTRTNRVIGVAGPFRADLERPDSAFRVLGDSVVAIVRRR